MNSIKTITIIVCGLLMSLSAMARMAVLNRTATVFYDARGHVVEEGTFFSGTRMDVEEHTIRIPGVGRVHRINQIHDVRSIKSSYRRDLALDINDNSYRDDFYIKARTIDFISRRDRPVRVNPRHDNRGGSRRDVILDRRERYDSGTIREVCYETPRRRVVTMNEERRDRGGRNLVGGIITTIGGQVLGNITGNDRLGDVVSAVGLGFAAVGAAQVASSQEVFYSDYEINCREYYTPDTRVYTFRRQGQRCSTTRYYSNSWGGTHEYFETVCHGRQTSRFVTFERSYEIYAY